MEADICRTCGFLIDAAGRRTIPGPEFERPARGRLDCLDCKKDITMIGRLNLIFPDYKPDFIVIHHSATRDGPTVSWDAIRKYHMETMGMQDIGYHFGTELSGTDYVIQVGRPMVRPGAHVKQGFFNKKSIGICIVGNWDMISVPHGQWILTRMLVEAVQRVCKIRPVNVIGHWEAQALAGLPPDHRKTCPGRKVNMDEFRAELADI